LSEADRVFIELPPKRPQSDPWVAETFAARIASLRRGKTRVAYYYDFPDSSTFRYRVYNMIQALRSRDGGISASWFCRADSGRFDQIVDCCDVLVIRRARYTDRVSSMIERAKSLGRTVIFDIDDLVFDTQYLHLVMATLDQDTESEAHLDHWFAYISRVSAALHLCDRVIATNEYLAARIRASTGKDVCVVPNFLNREQLEYSLQLQAAKRASRFASDEHIHLGYFSGSPSHDKDFELISDALAGLLDENPRLRVRIVGYLTVRGPMVRHKERIERFGMHDFLNLQRLIGSTEINLVPLQDNAFTNCKSELKFFEAGIVGTVTIASPVFAYRQAMIDGVNGYLAGPCEWEGKLRAAINTLHRSRNAYNEMAEQAFAIALSRFSWDFQFPVIARALLDAPTCASEKCESSAAICLSEDLLLAPSHALQVGIQSMTEVGSSAARVHALRAHIPQDANREGV
jgi:glycosyltransferase involved in cell wall biosynthesis